jgi:hypothetical protein
MTSNNGEISREQISNFEFALVLHNEDPRTLRELINQVNTTGVNAYTETEDGTVFNFTREKVCFTMPNSSQSTCVSIIAALSIIELHSRNNPDN